MDGTMQWGNMSIKIGDMTVTGEVPLPWAQVPNGALVRVLPDSHLLRLGHALRLGDHGRWANNHGYFGRQWRWLDGDWGGLAEQIQVVALGLTGGESADEILGLMTNPSPSVDPLIAAWSARYRGQAPKFSSADIRASFRPERVVSL